jgi:predicted transposase YdaD
VFLPPESKGVGVVYFCEVQFQKDENLYERVFAESSLYFYRNRARFSDWQAVIIYPSRSTEQDDLYPYRALLNSEQVHRIYLDELGEIRSLPLWVALMVLTTQEARYLLNRTEQEVSPSSDRAIIEMITTIMVYKFEALSRIEVESMLGITLKETQLYREIKQEGRKVEAKSLIIRQLTRRVGELSQELRDRIENLSLEELESLGEALLDFSNMADLDNWLT